MPQVPDQILQALRRIEDEARAAMDAENCAGFEVTGGHASCRKLYRDDRFEVLVMEITPATPGVPATFNIAAREGCTETALVFGDAPLHVKMAGDVLEPELLLIPTTSAKFVPGETHRVAVHEPAGFLLVTIPAEPEEVACDATHAGGADR